MATLREIISNSRESKSAIGHFNVSDIAMLNAIVGVAREAKVPVLVGVSEGEREFIGIKNIVKIVRILQEEGLVVFLNADHTHSFDKAIEAVDAGFDAVLFDGGRLPFEGNMEETKRVVEYARGVNPEIVVEGELGYIGSSSEIRENIPDGAAIRQEDLTSPEQAKEFVAKTGIDLLAPAVGNIHGMFANAPEPALDVVLVKEIAELSGVPLVLHGASGNTDDDIRAAVAAGANIVHVSTELRVAWRSALDVAMKERPREIAPYKIFASVVPAVKDVIMKKLALLGGI